MLRDILKARDVFRNLEGEVLLANMRARSSLGLHEKAKPLYFKQGLCTWVFPKPIIVINSALPLSDKGEELIQRYMAFHPDNLPYTIFSFNGAPAVPDDAHRCAALQDRTVQYLETNKGAREFMESLGSDIFDANRLILK